MFFSKKAWIILCKTGPDPICMACMVRVWPNVSGPEANRCAGIIGPSFWYDATGPLPIFHFQARFRSFTDVPDHIV